MINLLLRPTASVDGTKTVIKINGEHVQIDNRLYNFTDLADGVLRQSVDDIFSAKRVNGELYVAIFCKLDDKATQDDLYPQWQIITRKDELDDGLIVVPLDWYSDDERASDELLNAMQPSAQELSDADLEIKMITLMMDMGVLQ